MSLGSLELECLVSGNNYRVLALAVEHFLIENIVADIVIKYFCINSNMRCIIIDANILLQVKLRLKIKVA